MPQWALTGWPDHAGPSSLAALVADGEDEIEFRSLPGPWNALTFLGPEQGDVMTPSCSSTSSAKGFSSERGSVPAEMGPRKRSPASVRKIDSAKDRARQNWPVQMNSTLYLDVAMVVGPVMEARGQRRTDVRSNRGSSPGAGNRRCPAPPTWRSHRGKRGADPGPASPVRPASAQRGRDDSVEGLSPSALGDLARRDPGRDSAASADGNSARRWGWPRVGEACDDL